MNLLRCQHAIFISLLLGALLASCVQSSNLPEPTANPLQIPPGFPTPIIPAGNPITSAKVELGRYLFYATELSGDNAHSCASCHVLPASFCDPGKTWSFGVAGRHGFRNAPPLVNLAYDTCFFWDGRAASLEAQAMGPIFNPVELGGDSAGIFQALSKNTIYPPLFTRAFGDHSITMTRITQALASFERTMISGRSDYDRFRLGDSSALSDAQKRGLALFTSSSTNCSACHSGITFTDNAYHSTGLDFHYADQGRANVTHDPNDNGKFRTPTLRNIALTEPYMHDGRFNTLEQVLDHFNKGGMHNPAQDSLIHPLHLSQAQMDDIIAFLESLTDSAFVQRNDFSNPFR